MVKSDTILLLAAGYFLYTKMQEAGQAIAYTGQAIAAPAQALSQIPAQILQPISFIPAASQALLEAGASLIPGVAQEQQPLRTYTPVNPTDVRQIPVEEQYSQAYQEAIGVPVVTPEELLAQENVSHNHAPIDYTKPSDFISVGQASVPISSIPAKQQAAPSEQGPSDSWESGRVVGTRTTGGIRYNVIATGKGKEVKVVRV